MPRVAELLAQAQRLPGAEARRETEILLARALGKSRSYLYAWPEAEVPAEAGARFDAWFAERARGVPLAYLLGEREFWSLPLQVSDATLIPRPETELLVEEALALALPRDARVLDLGTGSGAIALALATERPAWRVEAVDASGVALETARANAGRLGLGALRWHLGSWFEPLGDARFDLIVANPPYLADDDPHLAQGDLRFEPRAALVAGPSGLEDLAHIVDHAPGHLRPGGWLLLEHGFAQGVAVGELLRGAGYAEVVLQRDLAGQPRLSRGRWMGGDAGAQ